MKKIIFLMFVIFLIPNIVLAAWWNPLTWFNYWGRGFWEEKNSNTVFNDPEINNSTSSIDSATKVDKQKIEQTSNKNISTSIDDDIKTQISTRAIESLTLMSLLWKSVDVVRSEIEKDLMELENQKRNLNLYMSGYGKDTDLSKWFIKFFELDISDRKRYLQYFEEIDLEIRDKIGYFQNYSQVSNLSNYSNIQLQVILSEIESENNHGELKNKVDIGSDKYVTYKKERDNQFDDAMIVLKGSIDSLVTYKNTSIDTYRVDIDKYMPKKTYCEPGVFGSFSCTSF